MDRNMMIDFLESFGIKTKLLGEDEHFKREIEFTVSGIRYVIDWYVNESTLKIGEGDRRACIPFRYIYHDNTYPIGGGNRSIGFSYTKNEKSNFWERMYPYEVLRIPLEIIG